MVLLSKAALKGCATGTGGSQGPVKISHVVQTFRSARHGRPAASALRAPARRAEAKRRWEGLHYNDFFPGTSARHYSGSITTEDTMDTKVTRTCCFVSLVPFVVSEPSKFDSVTHLEAQSDAAGLVSCLRSSFAFGRRCIPPRGVARRSNTPGILPPRALLGGRLGALGATTNF